jgi:surface protein
MFESASSFNQNITNWEVGNVESMAHMFADAVSFNQDINDWNVSNVRDLYSMFSNATAFNQNIGSWALTNAIDAGLMFAGATAFNQDISNWDVSNIGSMMGMFAGATSFNQNIGNWDASNVEDMTGMFYMATSFNQDIGSWVLTNVKSTVLMFNEATSFNQVIGDWDVSNVEDMSDMFANATSFNQNIGNWNVSNVASMSGMFTGVTLTTENYDALLNGWSARTLQPNVNFDGGNSIYSCGDPTTARAILTGGTNNWTITDGGFVDNTPVLTIADPEVACGSVDITSTSVITGNTNSGTLSYWEDATASTPLVDPTAVTASDTYYIKSTNACGDAIEAVTVTVNSAPVLTIVDPAASCNSVDITSASVITGNTSGGILSYWENVTATTSLVDATAVTTSGTYYIKSSNTCGDAIEAVNVSINAPAPVLTIVDPAAGCGSMDITSASVITGNTNGGTLSFWENATATTPLVDATAVTSSGTYYIKSTNACGDVIEAVNVTVNSAPVLTIVDPAETCGSVDITSASFIIGNTNGGTLSFWENATATTPLVDATAVTASGTYYIKSTNACGDVIEAVNVTVSSAPVLTIVDPAASCNSVDITSASVITGNTSGGTLSYWEDATANTTPLVDATAVTTSGTYYIKSTNACGDANEAVTVTVNSAPQQPIIVDNLVVNGSKTLCPGEKLVCSNFDDAYSYQWLLDGNDILGQTSHEFIVSGNGSGVYSLAVVNASCMSVSEPLTVVVHDVEIPTVHEKKQEGTISILVVDNTSELYVSYLWKYADGAELPSVMPSGRQFLTLPASAMNGQYMVQVSDINGCTLLSEPKMVTLTGLKSTVFPTINNGSFTIELLGEQTGKVKIDLCNQLGVALREFVYEKQDAASSYKVIDAGLSSGSYHMTISIGDVRKTHTIIVK